MAKFKLTPEQTRWLAARSTSDTDADASRTSGISISHISRWKHSGLFRVAYNMILREKGELQEPGPWDEPKPEPVIELEPMVHEQVPEIPLEPGGDLIEASLLAYIDRIPRVMARLFDIALTGRDIDALKAIHEIGNWWGINPDRMNKEKLTFIQQQVLNWGEMKQYEQPDDNDSQAALEGTFREVPAVQ